jgi:hypothetical protein
LNEYHIQFVHHLVRHNVLCLIVRGPGALADQ